MKTVSFRKYLFKDFSTLIFIIMDVLLFISPCSLLFFTNEFEYIYGIILIPFLIILILFSGERLYYIEVNEEEILKKNLIYFWFEKKIKKEEILAIKNSLSFKTDGEGNPYCVHELNIETINKNYKINIEHSENYFLELHRVLKKFNYNSQLFKDYSLPLKITQISSEFKHPKYKKDTSEEITLELGTSFFLYSSMALLASFVFIGPAIGISFFLTFSLLPAIMIAYHFWNKKLVTFNRRKGIVTLTSKFNKKDTIVDFKNLNFHIFFEPDLERELDKLIIEFPKNKEILNLYCGENSKSLFSYLVWFMDKNRCLPIGYYCYDERKKDYERRKEEGVLHPLYPSEIEINEEEVF